MTSFLETLVIVSHSPRKENEICKEEENEYSNRLETTLDRRPSSRDKTGNLEENS
ncbi:hypothetical protein Fmac_032287 [Flemingia macrophylla]|uniref:Uncharacterized protein n=1 Tax=Flemingia macrophylla TaxID=520843 RepID=A0ABD1L4H5_9FABA